MSNPNTEYWAQISARIPKAQLRTWVRDEFEGTPMYRIAHGVVIHGVRWWGPNANAPFYDLIVDPELHTVEQVVEAYLALHLMVDIQIVVRIKEEE